MQQSCIFGNGQDGKPASFFLFTYSESDMENRLWEMEQVKSDQIVKIFEN